MERLQEALKRARAQREQVTLGRSAPKPQTSVRTQPGPPPPGDLDEAWLSVAEFVPTPRIMRRNRVVSFFGGPEASAFDMMRTKIVQMAKSQNLKRIMVTSPGPGCGKTTTAANLAFCLARQVDLRTIVVDIDLRRPNLGALLGIEHPQQFSRVFARQAEPREEISRIGSNLIVATNTTPVANSSELVQSQSAQDMLAEIEREFQPDFLLFDAPPVLTSDDSIGFMEHCDAAIIVAAAEQSSIEELDITEAEVAAVTTVLGVVLNKCRYTNTNYDYY